MSYVTRYAIPLHGKDSPDPNIYIYIYIEIETIDLLSFRLIGTINFSLSNTKHERSELIIIPIKLLEDKVAPYLETGPAAWEEIFL